MTPRFLRAPLAALALALTVAACARKSVAPEPPASFVPPAVVLTQPSAFSTGVLLDAEIWAQFDRPLDPGSVDSTTVYLKVDTRRQAADIRYEPFTRRVLVTPRQSLSLLQTYTVEFSPSLRDTGSVEVGVRRFFQFTTTSLRSPTYAFPAAGELESPYAMLSWSVTAVAGSSLSYEVFADTDSVVVLTRQVAPLQSNAALTYVPATTWPRGSRVYWSVRANNLTHGDRSEGAVRSFRTYGPADPVDSLVMNAADWSGLDPNRFQLCTFDRVYSGGFPLKGAIRFPTRGLPALRLASARLELHVPPEWADSIGAPGQQLELWSTSADWNACSASPTGQPLPSRRLAIASAGPVPRSLVYEGDGLAAFFEAQARRTGFFGPMLQSTRTMAYLTAFAPDLADYPKLVLTYYVPRTTASNEDAR